MGDADMSAHHNSRLASAFASKNVVKSFYGVAAIFLLVAVAACNPTGAPLSSSDLSNQQNVTGYQTQDGKAYTGAAGDDSLDRLKDQLANVSDGLNPLSKIDRELVDRIVSARVDSPNSATIRVLVEFRDLSQVTFDFTESDVAAKSPTDAANEVRYKNVSGKSGSGEKSDYELAMLCRKTPTEADKPVAAGCIMTTLALKETAPNGAKAGLIVRNQEVVVSVFKDRDISLKHEILKRLMNELEVKNRNSGKAGVMRTFEVAWGRSGFALAFGDAQVCPVGQLVETNDRDEQLRLNCEGTEKFRDLEGRMIGNTTRGQLLLQISAATTGIFFIENVEHIFMLVRRKMIPNKTTTPKPGAAHSVPGKTPPAAVQPAPPAGTTPGASDPKAPIMAEIDDDDDGADDPVFKTEGATDEVPAVQLPDSAGWLIPVNANHPYTKTFANDRRHPSIAKGVKELLNGRRLRSFAQNFLPNRTLVFNRLAQSQVAPEFALIMYGESEFFIASGYPVQGPGGSSAFGPWQFLDQTATNSGLRIRKRNVGKSFIPGQPCDERADLAKSSEAAGRYLRSIIKMFPNDPKLVLLGYNQGEYGVQGRMNSLKNTGSAERLAVIREMGLNYWTIKRFNMATRGGMSYVEKFVSLYHAALESEPVKIDQTVPAWQPNPKCRLY
jgi:hypothetical protein